MKEHASLSLPCGLIESIIHLLISLHGHWRMFALRIRRLLRDSALVA